MDKERSTSTIELIKKLCSTQKCHIETYGILHEQCNSWEARAEQYPRPFIIFFNPARSPFVLKHGKFSAALATTHTMRNDAHAFFKCNITTAVMTITMPTVHIKLPNNRATRL